MNWKIRFVTPRSSFFPGSVYDEYDFYFSTDHHNHHNRFQTKPKHAWKDDLGIRLTPGGGEGVLPYITYTGMCRPTGSWFWSSWFRTGYPFQRHFLERGIIFRTHESSSFVSGHLKLFKDTLLLKILLNALTSKLLYSLYLRTEYKKLTHF